MVHINGYYIYNYIYIYTWFMMVNNHPVGGYVSTPLKKDGLKVSWDDDIPNMMGKIKFTLQTTNQYIISH